MSINSGDKIFSLKRVEKEVTLEIKLKYDSFNTQDLDTSTFSYERDIQNACDSMQQK